MMSRLGVFLKVSEMGNVALLIGLAGVTSTHARTHTRHATPRHATPTQLLCQTLPLPWCRVRPIEVADDSGQGDGG